MKDKFESIEYREKKETAIITLNRPLVYNALDKKGKKEIIKALSLAKRSEHIRSIILTGAGKAFCSGQDLNDRTVKNKGPVDLGKTLATEWNPLMQAVRRCQKPVIAAINGTCAGAGLSLAVSCDLLLSVPKAKFVSGFSKLGLAPDAGSNFIFVRSLGKMRCLEFFLFNNPLLAEDLHRLGIINRISPEVLEGAEIMAAKINALAPCAVQMIKKNINHALDAGFNECLEREVAVQRFLGNTPDYQEGLDAFFNKREPRFTGKTYQEVST